jgi:hypothetical protein
MTYPEAHMGSLSDEDRAELDKLRQERADRQAAEEKAKADAPPDPDPIYWLHLANGEVIESTGQMTHYKGIQVVGAYPITKEEGA